MARKEKKYYFIYKTTNLLTSRYYLGMHSTNNLNDGYMGSGKRLRYSINKYGKENHKVEIIEFVNSREELKEREKEIVTLNEIAKVECMNLVVGGEGGFISLEGAKKGGLKGGKVHAKKMEEDVVYRNNVLETVSKASKERWKDHICKNKMLEGLNWDGKSHSEKTKEKMSQSHIGKHFGESNSQYGTCWITKNGENKKIKKEDLETHLNDGWIKGRKL